MSGHIWEDQMRKIKNWLINRVLPIWARQELQDENQQLRSKILELQAKIREQAGYIEGLEYGLRSQRRIIINAKEVGK